MAKQFASLSIAMGQFNSFSRSDFIGFPIKQTVLLFFKTPVSISKEPGVQIPILHSCFVLALTFFVKLIIRSMIASYPSFWFVGIRMRSTTLFAEDNKMASIFVPPRSIPIRFISFLLYGFY